jgi:glutamyl-Q tRNA(Asp) synthetase
MTTKHTGYIGRFAPSPTGPLHAGSLVAALASWLDARANGGQWLVRIEDVDTTRCLPGMDQVILQQLAACGLHCDHPPVYQSRRSLLYQSALSALVARGDAYPCACSRKDIELARQQRGQTKSRHGELIYPGTCRNGLQGETARAWRFRTDISITNTALAQSEHAQEAIDSIATPSTPSPASQLPDTPQTDSTAPTTTLLHWSDRRLGEQSQDVALEVGDFILKRADGCFAYQLAVVVDDGAQGITDVVRGVDLADNTARQILLQRALALPTPRYLHTPLVLGADGEKLSKQNGAQALDTSHPLAALNSAATVLGLDPQSCAADALTHWTQQWWAKMSITGS